MRAARTKDRRWLARSPGVDAEFSTARYLTHLARSSFLPMRVPERRPRVTPGAGDIAVTFIGHATVLIELDGVRIVTDPVLSERLFILRRIVAPGLPHGGLGDLDLVLVSHGHHDHLDLRTHRRLPKNGTIALVAENLSDLVRPTGYERVVEMPWGAEFEHKGVRVTALRVNHWGTRGIFPDNRGYTGYLIEGPSGAVFFPGDTAYTPLFREYGERYSIDVAVLPIGAYSPRSFRRVHMNPEDAFQAFVDLRARYLVPIHWGTFVLSYEPVDEPPAWIERLAAEHGRRDALALLRHGEGTIFSSTAARADRGAG